MASYNTSLGMWRASNGGYYGSREEAEAVEAGAAPSTSTPDTLDEGLATGGLMTGSVRAPLRTDAELLKDKEDTARLALEQPGLARTQSAQRNESQYRMQTGDATGLTTEQNTKFSDAFLEAAAADPNHPDHEYAKRLGYVTSEGFSGGVEELSIRYPEQSGTKPATATDARYDAAAADTAQAEDRFNDEHAENAAENENAWSKAWDQYDNLEASDYGLSDEARSWQREGLQQQRQLLERMLGFDPNAYAAQYADQALARSVALGRSQGGGAAAQQAGVFAALEQAPGLQAEGARQSSSLENQRLTAAAGVAKSFGELGTLTRGQDEGRAQFESSLGVQIADSVARLSQGQVQLNQQESQMFAEMWMDFARLQSVYAGMSSQEQMAWWQTEAAKRGQDKQLEAVMENIRANGAIDDKDLMDGLFQLGGGLIGAGARILGA